MGQEIKRALEQFLEEKNISIDTGIVNEIAYRLAGVSLKKKDFSEGFTFSLADEDEEVSDAENSEDEEASDVEDNNDEEVKQENKEKKEKITFTLPSGLDSEQIPNILKLFNLSKYKVENDLILDTQFVTNDFLPKFKNCFSQMEEKEPETIAKYKIKSAPILESSARNTISQYASDVRRILLADNLKDLSPELTTLYTFVSTFHNLLSDIESYPFFYKNIINSSQEIEAFKLLPEVKSDPNLFTKVKMIGEGIELFKKYHRYESAVALITFKKELKNFLNPYRISTEAKDCNIVEEVVLDLAGIKHDKISSCEYKVGYDKSRFIIKYENFSKKNTKKVIDYLRKLGDETVCEGQGWRHYGSVRAESSSRAAAFCIMPSSGRKAIESHSIEMDGKFFYHTLYPLIKEQIVHMPEEQLAVYQKKSEKNFPSALKKDPEVSMSSISTFQTESTQVPVSSMSMFQAKPTEAQTEPTPTCDDTAEPQNKRLRVV